MLTARVITRATAIHEIADCSIIMSLAQRDNGRVSVGLKAVAFDSLHQAYCQPAYRPGVGDARGGDQGQPSPASGADFAGGGGRALAQGSADGQCEGLPNLGIYRADVTTIVAHTLQL